MRIPQLGVKLRFSVDGISAMLREVAAEQVARDARVIEAADEAMTRH